MGWFRRRTPDKRWPLDRWESIFTNRMLHALEKARRYEIEMTDLVLTRFYAGYLVGFPNYVAMHDRQLATGIRRGLLKISYGEAEAALVPHIERHMLFGDPQFNAGLKAGTEDGERFFQAVERNENP